MINEKKNTVLGIFFLVLISVAVLSLTVFFQERNLIANEKINKALHGSAAPDEMISGVRASRSSFFSRAPLIYRISQLLTLDAGHADNRERALASNVLGQMAKLVLLGDDNGFQKSLSDFKKITASMKDGDTFTLEIFKRFSFASDPKDKLWKVYDALRQLRIERLGVTQEGLEEKQNLIHYLLDRSSIEASAGARTSAIRFFDRYLGELSLLSTDYEIPKEVNDMRKLFIEYPYFIQPETIERFISEARKSISPIKEFEAYVEIVSKINSEFLKDDGVLTDVVHAREVVGALSREIDGLRRVGFGVDVDKIASVEAKLDGLTDFLAFMRSPEASQVTGSFDEAFQKFMDRKKEDELLQKFIPGDNSMQTERSLSGAELILQAEKDFESVGLTGALLTVADLDVAEISFEKLLISDVELSGLYSVDRKLFVKITANGTDFDQSVSLKNIQSFVRGSFGKIYINDAPIEESSALEKTPEEQSRLERIALSHTLRLVLERGFVVAKESISPLDLEQAVFQISNASWSEGDETFVVASFVWNTQTGVVSEVVVRTVLGDLPVNEISTFDDIKKKVILVIKRAVFENERLKEFESGLEDGAEQ